MREAWAIIWVRLTVSEVEESHLNVLRDRGAGDTGLGFVHLRSCLKPRKSELA